MLVMIAQDDPRQSRIVDILKSRGIPVVVKDAEEASREGGQCLVIVNGLDPAQFPMLSRLIRNGAGIVVLPLDPILSPIGLDHRISSLRTGAGISLFAFLTYCEQAHDEKRWGHLSKAIPYPFLLPDEISVEELKHGRKLALVDFPAKMLPERGIATPVSLGEVTPLVEGCRPYCDRDHAILRSSRSLEGCDVIRMPDAARDDPSFAICVSSTKPGTVFALVDEEAPQPTWLIRDGWRRCDAWLDIVESGTRRYRKLKAWFKACGVGEPVTIGAPERGALCHAIVVDPPGSFSWLDPLDSSIASAASIVCSRFKDLGYEPVWSGRSVEGVKPLEEIGTGTWEERAMACTAIHVGVPQRGELLLAASYGSKNLTTSWEMALEGTMKQHDPWIGMSPSGLVGRPESAAWVSEWTQGISMMSGLDPIPTFPRPSGKLDGLSIERDDGSGLAAAITAAMRRKGIT